MFTFFLQPKCPSGHVECSVDNPAEISLLRVRNFCARVRKNIMKFRSNVFLPKCSYGHVECIFDKATKNSSLTVRYFSLRSCKLLMVSSRLKLENRANFGQFYRSCQIIDVLFPHVGLRNTSILNRLHEAILFHHISILRFCTTKF